MSDVAFSKTQLKFRLKERHFTMFFSSNSFSVKPMNLYISTISMIFLLSSCFISINSDGHKQYEIEQPVEPMSNLIGQRHRDTSAGYSQAEVTASQILDFTVKSGKPTLIIIWATWCSPCIKKMPLYANTDSLYNDVLNILFIRPEFDDKGIRYFKQYHILRNDLLISSMAYGHKLTRKTQLFLSGLINREVDKEEMNGFPIYVILDENGMEKCFGNCDLLSIERYVNGH